MGDSKKELCFDWALLKREKMKSHDLVVIINVSHLILYSTHPLLFPIRLERTESSQEGCVKNVLFVPLEKK